jgi:hypothetical protein
MTMNAIVRLFCVLAVFLPGFHKLSAAPESTNPPAGFRLTVELREGSRVIGVSDDAVLKFHSDVLGEMKLPLERIRWVECEAKTNLAKLTTSGGDTLAVRFAMKEIRLETVYGDVKLPITMIRSIRVSALGKPGRPGDGLIGMWSGEGNAADSAGGNPGVMRNVSFADGVVGQAFTFDPDGVGGFVGVQIPDRPAYALTRSLTIEGWIRPRGNGYTILCRGDHRPGLDPYALSMQANHDLRFQITNERGESAIADANVPYYKWTHVAATLNGDTGIMSLYTNGVLAAQTETAIRPLGILIPELSPGVGIGNLNDGGNNFPFIGDIDELALYDRALSADEVNAIYIENAANAGGQADPLPTRNSRMPWRYRLNSE